MRCPICGKNFSREDPKVALPFCSPRCKSIDMKRWLGEEYSLETIDLDKLEERIVGVDSPSNDSKDD